MNNPLAGTDPTGYAGCAASRIQSKCDTTLSQHGGNGKADGKFFGGSSKSSGTVKSNGGGNYTASFQLNKTTSLEVDFKVNDIGGQEQIASNDASQASEVASAAGVGAIAFSVLEHTTKDKALVPHVGGVCRPNS
ncbi:hypothetical protein [Shewanella sp. WPAGA9]|nr:hypothetical protein [Shewanella sp. WPAGA9]